MVEARGQIALRAQDPAESAIAAFALWAVGMWLAASPLETGGSLAVAFVVGGAGVLGVRHLGVARVVAFDPRTTRVQAGRQNVESGAIVGVEEIDAGSPRSPAILVILHCSDGRRLGAGPFAGDEAATLIESIARSSAKSRSTDPKPAPIWWFFQRALCGAGVMAATTTLLFRHPVATVLAAVCCSALLAFLARRDGRCFEGSPYPRSDGVPRSLDRWLSARRAIGIHPGAENG